jgi:DNA-binding MarR family transcriptional regulator
MTTDTVRFREMAQTLYQRLGMLQREQVCCGDVTVQQCYALQILRSEGEMLPGALAERLGIDPSSATRAIDVLVRDGRVERVRPESGDRRTVILRLTKEGGRLAEQLSGAGDEFFASLLSGFSATERRELLRLLEKLTGAMSEYGACCGVSVASTPAVQEVKTRRRPK